MKNRLSDIAPLIVSSLLVSSFSKMVLKTLEINTPIGFIFIWSMLFVFSLYLILINKKVAIIIFSIIIISTLIIYLQLDDVNKKIVHEFFSKSIDFFRNGKELSELQLKIISAALVFGLSLIMVIPTIIFPFYPATLGISLAFILILWKKEEITYLTEISIIIGALIVFFAHSMKRETNNSTKKIRNVSATLIIPFAALISIVIIGVAESNDLDKKWGWLEVRTNIIKDYIADITGNTAPRTIYDISNVGYQPLDGRLGGPVQLDDTELFKYTSSTRSELLFRGNIKNTYIGNNWIDDAVSYRSRMINKYIKSQNNVFNLDLPKNESRENIYFENTKVLITPSDDLSATIFAPIRTSKVDPKKFLTMLISFNTEGEVFSSRDINKGISYTVSVDHIKYNTDSFKDYVAYVQSNLTEQERILDELIKENYTSQFENIPPSVSDLALEITKGYNSDYRKALAIKKYLETDFIYTLRPVLPPEHSDFVQHFIHTKKGYCTYFASAMAVLARSAGLPSRYVEGFRIAPVSQNSAYPITGENAHAWAEIFIMGIGWIPFDPETTSEIEESTGPSLITEDEDLFEGIAPQAETIDLVATEENNFTIYYLLISILAIIILVIISFIITAKTRVNIKFIKRRLKTANLIIRFYYTEIMMVLLYLNYEKPIGNTLKVYAIGVDKRIPLFEYNFNGVSLIVSKMIYAKKELSLKEAMYVNGYYKAINQHIVKTLGVFKYFFITSSILIKTIRNSFAKRFLSSPS